MIELYTYFRSSAAFRVRIALNLKDLDYQPHYVHLLKDGGQEKSTDYQQINPYKLVPSFKDEGQVITQSLAAIEYIDEKYPEPRLLPQDAMQRAQIRSLALSIACDVHPLNNLRVVEYLTKYFAMNEDQKISWIQHWIGEGFSALETQLNRNQADNYCYGNQVTLADLCLIPQVYNARRFNCDMNDYPIISRIYERCMQLPAFQKASPEAQQDCDI